MAGENLTKVSFMVNHPPCRPQVDDVTVMMHIIGSVKELGNWDAVHAKRMRKDTAGNWEISLYLPKATDVQYQYVLKDFDDNVVWQGQVNRKHHVMDRVNGFSVLQQLKDYISSEEGAEPENVVRTPRGMHVSSDSLLGKLEEPRTAQSQTRLAPSMLARAGVTPNRHRSVPLDNKDCVPIARPQNVEPRNQSMVLPTSVKQMMSRVGEEPALVPPAAKNELVPLREEDVSEIIPETPPTVEKLRSKESLTAESKEAVQLAMKQKSASSTASSATSSAAKKKKHRRSARNTDMRHNFLNFLEREAERKQQSLTTLKRRTLDVDDDEELEKLNSTCSSLSQELSDLDELLLDTREAVVVEAMERLDAQRLRRELKDKREEERLAALACIERPDSASPPPPLHHRAVSLATPPKPRAALNGHGQASAGLDARSHAQAPAHCQPARRSVPTLPGPAAAPWLSTHSAASARSSGSSYCAPRSRAVRAREAYCNTVSRKIAKPLVGPVDRTLGRMARWVYGDPVEQCRKSQIAREEARKTASVGGGGGGKYTALMKMCCTVDQDVLHDIHKSTVLLGEEERRMLLAVAEVAAQSEKQRQQDAPQSQRQSQVAQSQRQSQQMAGSQRRTGEMTEYRTRATLSMSAIVV
mmetsp:Transcript_24788/g.58919  ORF Transcript_24788/g.58919 Transcript_24788/m.58919 type:complete len:642 (+) Transcript_24788:69-1994(+)